MAPTKTPAMSRKKNSLTGIFSRDAFEVVGAFIFLVIGGAFHIIGGWFHVVGFLFDFWWFFADWPYCRITLIKNILDFSEVVFG